MENMLPSKQIFLSSTQASYGGVGDFVTTLNTPINVGDGSYSYQLHKYTHVCASQVIIHPLATMDSLNMEPGEIIAVIICSNIVKEIQFGGRNYERVLAVIPVPQHKTSTFTMAQLDNGNHTTIRITLKTLKSDGSLVNVSKINSKNENVSMMLSFV